MSFFHNNALAGASGQGGGGAYEIERSVRFNSADSAYLNRTPASAGNRKTYTLSLWLKRSVLGTNQNFFGRDSDSGFYFQFTPTDNISVIDYNDNAGADWRYTTTAVYRDTSAWYHIVLGVDTTQATASDRVKLYVNGARVTQFSTATDPSLNFEGAVNKASAHVFGRISAASAWYFNGYLADIHFIDGQALGPTSFGRFDGNSVWQPKAYNGTYGANGFHLDFSDNSAAIAAALGKDTSGNGNHWTPNNFSVDALPNYSVSFDGTNDSISVANAESLRMRTGDFTIEFWVRFNALSGYQTLFDKGYAGTGGILLQTNANSGNLAVFLNGATLFNTTGTVNTNTWYHYALVRSGSQVTMYRNGASVGSGTSSADFSDSSTLYIGGGPGGGGYPANALISNLRIVKGTAVYTSSFATPATRLTAIANTSLLTCQSGTFVDNSVNAFTVTANNGPTISSTEPFGAVPSGIDSLVDTPTNYGTDTGAGGEVRGNYCTLNTLTASAAFTLTNGSLDVSDNAASAPVLLGTIGVNSGKWYWEVTLGNAFAYVGAAQVTSRGSVSFLGGAAGQFVYNTNQVSASWVNGVQYNYSTASTATTGDVIGVALDFDSNVITFYKNGVSQGAFSSSVLGTSTWAPAFKSNTATSAVFNFGQRPFTYTAPSGFKALCTQNLPTPTILQGSTAMDVALWTGTGAALTPTSTLGFSPDLVWIKGRSGATDHALYDTVRGATIDLVSNSTAAETTQTQGLTAFNSNGFSVGTLAKVNTNTATYAAWAWDAGSSTVTNTSGSISSQVRANASAGFSVCTFSVTTANSISTFGHGLGVSPEFVIIKPRNTGTNWAVFHNSSGTSPLQARMLLNTTDARYAYGFDVWSRSSTTLGVYSSILAAPGTALDCVAYVFAPVAGYSAFGSYTGNGSADGPMVFCNFRPAFVLIKSSSAAGNWMMYDYARGAYNLNSKKLAAASALAENDAVNLGGDTVGIDFLSNGFKIRTTGANHNDSSVTYVYACFAENPFSLARAR